MRWVILGCCLSLAASAATGAPAQAVNAELLRLHDALKLSETQEAAWRTYTTAIAPNPQAQARHQSAQQLLPLVPTPRRLALIEATMSQDALDMRRKSVAVNAFYDQLSSGQKEVFDRETLPSASDDRDPGR